MADVYTVLRNAVKGYIDGGNLASDILESNVPLFEHLSFFSYDNNTREVLVLLTGQSPDSAGNIAGTGNLQRNVITTQYCSAIIAPCIMEKFGRVNDVKVLLSGDPRFNDAVNAKGGTVSHPDFWNTPIDWIDSKRFYGGIHPNVQGAIKTVVNQDNNTAPIGFGSHTTPQFFNSYEMIWFLTPESRVMSVDGDLLHGEQDILRGVASLPAALEIRTLGGPAPHGIGTGTADFFSDAVYKLVSF